MMDSGNCNVCSAPCASCTHFNRFVTGVKTETAGETFCDNTSTQHSANKSTVLNPSKKHLFDNLQDTASATSSHESISENNETVSGAKSHGRDHVLRSMTSDLNVEASNKFGQQRGGKCIEGSVPMPSYVSLKPGMKAELKTESCDNDIPEESMDVSASRGTSNDMEELPDARDSLSESHSGDENEEIVEHDVNICDICGDAGREDLLATCSGCSDGAEHTYCMQVKMEKVPEGEWFCEECRLAEKFQKQRDTGDEATKAQPYSRLRSLNRNLSLKLDSKELYVDGNSAEPYTPGMQSRKRLLEKVESSYGLKRRATENTKDLSAASSPHHLSLDGSFKSGAREKVNNSLHQPSHGTNNVGGRPQTHKGLLSKSNSFNSVSLRSKGKSIDDTSLKQKTHRDHTDAPDGPNRLISRSMSLRPVHSGRPGEPKVKMLSPRSHVSEIKGCKKSNEHLSYDRKKSIRDDRSCENDLMSSENNSRDSKATQSNEKVVPLSKFTGHATRSALDIPEKKPTKHGQDESVSGTWTAAKHLSNVDAILNSELQPPQDASYNVVKNTDKNLTRFRPGKSTSGSSLCQWCKEPLSAAHVCLSISPRKSAPDPPTAKIPADEIEKMNPVKAALHAAFLKKSIIGKRSAPDNEQPITPNLNGQHGQQDLWSVSNYTKNSSSAEKKHIQKLPLHNFKYAAGEESSIDNLNNASLLPKDILIHTDIGCDGKSNTKTFPSRSLSSMCSAPTSAIPVHEYIWQGDFEVTRNGEKVADVQPGFQAHLSTFASPKVIEIVQPLSPRLLLTEIPRRSAWPAKFHETGASEDNIALYFFARDIESYERYYKILLDKMMRHDLALMGNVNGVDVLIFPSSQLPPKSQRWNMLFFLWGVFHAKSHDCQTQMAGISRNLDASGKPSIIASDVSPSLPVPAHPVPLTDSSCTRPISKRNPANSYEEEHVVGKDCEVKPKPRLDGRPTVTDGTAMLGDKGTPLPKSSASDDQGQERHYVDPEGINYVPNEEKEVDRPISKISIKVKEGDSDVPPLLKKEPSMKDPSANDFVYGQSNAKNHCHEDPADISCLDSDLDIGKSHLATTGCAEVKIPCSISDSHEAGPSTSSSKKIMYDLNLDARHIMDESGQAEGFLSAVESTHVIAFQGANSSGWDLNSSANDLLVDDDSKDGQDPDFGLTLCVDTKSIPSRNDALSLFAEMGKPFEGSSGRKEDAPAASLSLSLGLPFMDDKNQSSKPATTSAEQLCYGPTQARPPFLLFGKLADK